MKMKCSIFHYVLFVLISATLIVHKCKMALHYLTGFYDIISSLLKLRI